MTCREKLKLEHPEYVNEELAEWIFDDCDEYGYTVKCSGCGRLICIPYKYIPTPRNCTDFRPFDRIPKPDKCTRCGSKMKV